MATEPRFVSKGDKITAAWANGVVGSIKQLNVINGVSRQRLQGRSGSSFICPFGEIISVPGVSPEEPPIKKIRGGVVIAGPKTFNVPDYDFGGVETDKDVVIFLNVNLTGNTDDDHQLFLPGIKDSTWTPIMEEALFSTGYPNGTFPVLPSGEGTLVVPLGHLTVLDGVATFIETGCGTITLDQCGSGFSEKFFRPTIPDDGQNNPPFP